MAHFEFIDSDFSSLEGTCCYCSAESAAVIRGRLAPLPLEAIHMIGTGDFHYMTLFWAERISEPFELILFDNHPDDQPTAFGGDILSCGGWVNHVRALPFCKCDRWIKKEEELSTAQDSALPVYLSIDLDVLSTEFACTDWDQGTMTLDGLCRCISAIAACRRIIGVDFCGGITPAQGATDADLALNAATVSRLSSIF